MNTDHVNYSEQLSRQKKMHVGALQGPLEFALGPTGPSVKAAETKFQRFERLQAEVKALLDEIGEDVDKQQAVKSAEEPLPSYVHKELKALHLQLANAMGNDKVHGVLVPSSGEYLAVSTSVEDVLQRAVNAVHSGGATLPSAPVTYELYASPAIGGGRGGDSFAALERRVSKLEQALGRSGDSGLSLWEEVSKLGSQMETLEASKLEEIAAKFRAAAEAISSYERERKLNPAASASIAAPVITEARVASMLETINQWESFATTLPAIVARLRALREV